MSEDWLDEPKTVMDYVGCFIILGAAVVLVVALWWIVDAAVH